MNRLRRRDPSTALERDFYTRPEDFQIDLELIWYRDWLFVGHDCEVLAPGQYLTVQVGEYPVIVLRDRDARRNDVGPHRRTSARATSGGCAKKGVFFHHSRRACQWIAAITFRVISG